MERGLYSKALEPRKGWFITEPLNRSGAGTPSTTLGSLDLSLPLRHSHVSAMWTPPHPICFLRDRLRQ